MQREGAISRRRIASAICGSTGLQWSRLERTDRAWRRWPHFPVSEAAQGLGQSTNTGSGYLAALL